MASASSMEVGVLVTPSWVRSTPFWQQAPKVAFVAGVVLAYEVARRLFPAAGDTMPPFPDIVSSLFTVLGHGDTWIALRETVIQWGGGLMISTAIAVPLGLAIGSVAALDRAFGGIIDFMRPVPAPALVPLAILAFGLDTAMTLFLVVFGAVWPFLVQVVDGARGVDPLLLDTARSFRVRGAVRAISIRLPAAMPSIATGLRLASSICLILAITANVTAGSPGIGLEMTLYEGGGDNATLYALVIVVGILGAGSGWLIHRVATALTPWASRQAPVARSSRTRVRPAWLGPVYAIGTPILLVVLWQLFADRNDSFLIVGPREIATGLADLWTSPDGLDDLQASLVRIGLGFGVAVVVGVALGAAIGLWAALERAAMPTLDFMRSLPATAIVPIGIATFGLGNAMQVFVIAFGSMWPIVLNTAAGIAEIHPTRTEVCRAYRIRFRTRLTSVVLPSALPHILTGLRTSLAIAVIVLTVSELLGSTEGLGHYVLSLDPPMGLTAMM